MTAGEYVSRHPLSYRLRFRVQGISTPDLQVLHHCGGSVSAGRVYMKRKLETQYAFKDADALAFSEDASVRQQQNSVYIEKRKRSSKGLEIVFDPAEHRQVTSISNRYLAIAVLRP